MLISSFSLSVTRKGSKTFLTANAMGPRRSLRLASFSILPSRQTVITHLQAQTCSLSTSASRFTQKTVSNVKQDVVSSALPPVKKHKVDLRPAPMKIPKSQVSAGPPPTQPVPPHTAVKTSLDTKSDEASATISSEKTGTVAETTRRDFEVASQHGILAPPPEDASRIYKLFHQAKELFVRISIVISSLYEVLNVY